MLRMKDTNKLINNVLRALPAISLLRRRRRAAMMPYYIAGALGVAIVGGITAVMLLSPRTRNRTLGMAKDGYGKVRGQLGHLGIAERLGRAHGERVSTADAYSNGLGGENAGPNQSSPTY